MLINIRDRNPMTNNGLTKYLNKIFKPRKKISMPTRRLKFSFFKIYLKKLYPALHVKKKNSPVKTYV